MAQSVDCLPVVHEASWAQWCTNITPVPGRWRQRDQKLKVILGCLKQINKQKGKMDISDEKILHILGCGIVPGWGKAPAVWEEGLYSYDYICSCGIGMFSHTIQTGTNAISVSVKEKEREN